MATPHPDGWKVFYSHTVTRGARYRLVRFERGLAVESKFWGPTRSKWQSVVDRKGPYKNTSQAVCEMHAANIAAIDAQIAAGGIPALSNHPEAQNVPKTPLQADGARYNARKKAAKDAANQDKTVNQKQADKERIKYIPSPLLFPSSSSSATLSPNLRLQARLNQALHCQPRVGDKAKKRARNLLAQHGLEEFEQ
ncbi:hypothetical protein JCM10213_001927 [Rhodosporidiobolus nylandii]